MKKILLFLVLTMAIQSFYAQTQQGYVKTLGRPEKRGEPIGGVTVRVRGSHNYVVSESDGTFSMLMPEKKNGDAYSLQQVLKDGFELNENDMIGRQLAFSDKVPLTIVMVSSEQLQADKQRIENNAYKTAEKNYKAKFDRLEKQKAKNEITIEEYRKEIQDLKDKFEKYQVLIDGLAEHYSHTDYDELDEKEREINICIENGELDRADSLICMLFNPINVLKCNKEALPRLDLQIGQANDIIAQANADMTAVLKQQEKDAEYLYQLYTIALVRFDNEKALYYIGIRAELDTTNPGWQFDAGYYCQGQKDFVQARKFYSRALEIYRRLAKDTPQTYEPNVATTLNNLAVLYKDTQHPSESEAMYLEALEIRRRLKKNTSQANAVLAMTLNNLANLYKNTQRYEESETMYFEALKIQKRLAKGNPQAYEPNLATTLDNFAVMYQSTQRFTESEKMFVEALRIRRRLAKADPKVYEPDLAMTLNNLAVMYESTQRFTESETVNLEVLEIYRRLAKDNPQSYELVLATTLNNLAVLYKNIQRFTESEALYLESMEIRRRLANNNPRIYKPDLAMTLNELADLYYKTQRFAESEEMRLEVLDIYKLLAKDNPQVFESNVAMTLNNLAVLYSDTQRFTESEDMLLEVLEVYRRLTKDTSRTYESDLAKTLNNLADLYYKTQRFAESETKYLEALEIRRRLAKDTPRACEPDLAITLGSLAVLYYNSQRLVESMNLLLEALEIYRRLAKGNPQTYEPDFATTLYSIGLLYWQQEQYFQAISYFEEALALYKSLELRKTSYGKWHEKSLYFLAQLYQMTNEHDKFYMVNEERISLLKKHYQDNAEIYLEDYANALGSQSFQCIFVGRFEESEQYARETLSIDSTQHRINSNLAAALLFQGKYYEAEAIYCQYMGELKETFLQDLNDFEAAGIIPDERKVDVEHIKEMLTEE